MKISVVIPTFNRRELLGRTLPAVLAQDFPIEEFEIVVVSDGSTDGTVEWLCGLKPRCALQVVDRPHGGAGAARNAGVAAARGETILFLDDDLLAPPSLVQEHAAAHSEPGPAIVFGPLRVSPDDPPSLERDWMRRHLQEFYAPVEQTGKPYWPGCACVGPNCSAPRSLLQAGGGFRESPADSGLEDVELGLRLWADDVPFRYRAGAVVHHVSSKPARQLLRNAWRDGAALWRLGVAHPAYRPHSPLALLGQGSASKHALRAVAARALGAFRPLADLAVMTAETVFRATGGRMGFSLFQGLHFAGLAAGAAHQAGSWRALQASYGLRLSVLLYHRVAAQHAGPHSELTIAPQRFEQHMAWLKRHGYTPILPRDWLTWRQEGKPLPDKPLLLTFDDAYADLAEHAFPTLAHFGFGAAVFVPTAYIGDANHWDDAKGIGPYRLLSAEQIRTWAACGIEFGAHTRTHLSLPGATPTQLKEEIAGSAKDLAALLRTQPVSFAYPYGDHDAPSRAAAANQFPLAFSCEEGSNTLATDPALLRRTMVLPGDSLLEFGCRARFGFNPFLRLRGRLTGKSQARKPASSLRGESASRVRILHLLQDATVESLAPARTLEALAPHLDPNRYEMHAWFLGEGGPLVERLERAGVKTRVLPWRGFRRRPMRAAALFAKAFQGGDFALVHQHIGGRSARWVLKKFFAARVVLHVHARFTETPEGRRAAPDVCDTDAVIAVSQAVAEKITGGKVSVIYPGVELPEETTGALQTGRVVGTASRLTPAKGIGMLLHAVALLREDFPFLRLEIAGDGPARAALEAEATSLGLRDHVSFLGWREDVVSVMRQWDVFVLPSLEESFSLATVEAMSVGLPVVATHVGGVPEVVDDGRTGLLVPPNDSTALAGKLRELLLDSGLRRELGRAGRERVRAHFSAQAMAAAIARVYDSLLAPERR